MAHRCCINLQKWEDIVLFAVENFDGKITFCLQESEGNKISNEIQKSDIIKHVLKIFEESTNINGFKILFGVLEEGVSSSLSSLHPSHFSDNLTSPDLLYYKVLENCILSGSEFQCHVDLHDL